MEELSYKNLPRIIDISALSVTTTERDIRELAALTKKYHFIAAFVMPNYISYLRDQLGQDTDAIIGAPIGFPTGADLTQDKCYQVGEMKKLGCTEFDMVMNIGRLKSGNLDYVKKDIAKVIDAADGYPVKVIIEVTYLTDDEIKTASEIVAESGAVYIKTGTGYSAKPTETHHVKVIKQTVGNKVKIKVAGGVRNFQQIRDFYNLGVTRFGIGMNSALNILNSIRDD